GSSNGSNGSSNGSNGSSNGSNGTIDTTNGTNTTNTTTIDTNTTNTTTIDTTNGTNGTNTTTTNGTNITNITNGTNTTTTNGTNTTTTTNGTNTNTTNGTNTTTTTTNGTIYCFGGKQTEDEETYGGLYRIDLNLNPTTINSSGFFQAPSVKWFILRDDSKQPSGTPNLRGRLGHSLIYIPQLSGIKFSNSLAVVGGQRGKENFKEIQFYALESDTVYQSIPFPFQTEGRVIQRTILYKTDLIILFTHGKEKDTKLTNSTLYSFSLKTEKWRKIQEEHKEHEQTPHPRSAHQFVLCGNKFLLFGGNVGENRVNDLWKLSLVESTREESRKEAIFILRKHAFYNLLDSNKLREAVEYLRGSIKPIAKKEDFEKLCLEIFEREDEADAYEEISKRIIV
ncbi:hypothetical protein NGRA_1224, partial [Nosema granulosis]